MRGNSFQRVRQGQVGETRATLEGPKIAKVSNSIGECEGGQGNATSERSFADGSQGARKCYGSETLAVIKSKRRDCSHGMGQCERAEATAALKRTHVKVDQFGRQRQGGEVYALFECMLTDGGN